MVRVARIYAGSVPSNGVFLGLIGVFLVSNFANYYSFCVRFVSVLVVTKGFVVVWLTFLAAGLTKLWLFCGFL
jgi:hypothetical protein